MRFLSVALAFAFSATASFAQVKTEDESCSRNGAKPSLRQTVVIVDGNVAVPDKAEGPAPENQEWRKFTARFFDANNQNIDQVMAPRERITIAIANSDGSGLTSIFTGCVPLVSKAEADSLNASTTSMQKFFGKDWVSAQRDVAESFTRAATLALIEGLKKAKVGVPGAKKPFAHGALMQAINKGQSYSIASGLPRVIVYSDLTRYDVPVSDVAGSRQQGRMDAEAISLDLQRADIDLFSTGSALSEAQTEYLKAFFLAGKAKVDTIGSSGSSLTENREPVSSAVYQGAISYGKGQYPVRMRLARDQNGSVVMSWMEEQSNRTLFAPFSGILNCESESKCEFVGDRVFAQIWTDKPGPEPACEKWMPFGGLRDLSFALDGDVLNGKISDGVCIINSMEDGVEFQLRRVPNAVF
ncbi:hypothetical protein IE4771_PB00298 (plasmid) [Rhizobium etli bv. mimosae str. IE4771]|uniref:Uncharacterized protein n=1 Tax=Rhizobium etli bv. mimosae str. IE4771 TaxID=1432050 RepID=A0A060IEB6_RHIET|nr:hypothetical protein [Rhizobium sp. IE4771]AIC30026.1 hypothetical protein IE4771_PB00298 [Rhizobium sp. IE4771]